MEDLHTDQRIALKWI